MIRSWIKWAVSAVMMLATLFALFVGFSAIVLGWQFNTVMSGSMSPTLEEGDIVVAQPVNPEAIEVGDIITYYSPQLGKTVVHRVIEKHMDSELYASPEPDAGSQLCFRTQGDANENPDSHIVPAQNVVGRVRFDVPLLGHALQSLKTPLGSVLLFGLPGAMIMAMELKNISAKLSKLRNGKKAAEPSAAGRSWTAGLRTEDWLS